MATLSRTGAILLAAFCLCRQAQAGPPFVTDDPEPAKYRTWEINYAMTGTRTAGQTAGSVPQIDANLGAAPGVQFHIQPQMAFTSSPDNRAYGVGDTEVGVKYRLTPEEQDPAGWMVSVYPILTVPTGSARRGLGAGAGSLYVPLWLQTTRGKWTVYGGGGYHINSGTGNRNDWAAGCVALYQFTEKLQFGGELFARTRDTDAGSSASGFNLGGHYDLGKDHSLLFSAGRGLTDVSATNQASAYVALQVVY